jgi:hypothetical protein
MLKAILITALVSANATSQRSEPRLDSAQGPLIHVKEFAGRSHMIV